MTNRSDKSTFRFLFDAADPENVVSQRNTSTVAPQALFLLNNKFAQDCAGDLARRLLSMDEPDTHRITRAYALLYGRPPTEIETEMGLRFIGASTGLDDAAPDSVDKVPRAWQDYCQALLCANELVYLN
jgi:hypothetical protein